MELFEAIRGRRSIGKFAAELPVSREQIERLLEAANWAPSHHATEPWRFTVLTGGGRQLLSDAYAAIAEEEAKRTGQTENLEELRRKQAAKAFRAPVVIAVSVSPSADPHVQRAEEFAAAHAAVQNLLLAAHALGLGAIWRSGAPMVHPRMKAAFELSETEELVALVYIGAPDREAPTGRRRPVSEKIRWLDEAPGPN
ncbi:nitroreductase family protein [Gorillibacterium timonense]|uniref:nitroreductase family protein n=1 Tax=Gorillibacterium timonense TaxID=1689269 RepID=UPI00071D136D|nr:nitroreductase family protein [Gorillibacterium timonense]